MINYRLYKDYIFRGFSPCPDSFLECQDLDTEKTRETHNLYIESIRRSLKNINYRLCYGRSHISINKHAKVRVHESAY